MNNAHLRFGWLTYVKSTEKGTTSIKLRLDRFIGELLPDPPGPSQGSSDFRNRRGYADCSCNRGHLAGRSLPGGRTRPRPHSRVPRTECSVLQGIVPTRRPEEAVAPSDRDLGRVCRSQHLGTIENTPRVLGQKFPMGFDRTSLRHSWNARLGGMVHE